MPNRGSAEDELTSLLATARQGKCRYCRTKDTFPEEDAAIIKSIAGGTRAWARYSLFLSSRGIDMPQTAISYHFREAGHRVEG